VPAGPAQGGALSACATVIPTCRNCLRRSGADGKGWGRPPAPSKGGGATAGLAPRGPRAQSTATTGSRKGAKASFDFAQDRQRMARDCNGNCAATDFTDSNGNCGSRKDAKAPRAQGTATATAQPQIAQIRTATAARAKAQRTAAAGEARMGAEEERGDATRKPVAGGDISKKDIQSSSKVLDFGLRLRSASRI
jgi:hypothetical protein